MEILTLLSSIVILVLAIVALSKFFALCEDVRTIRQRVESGLTVDAAAAPAAAAVTNDPRLDAYSKKAKSAVEAFAKSK